MQKQMPPRCWARCSTASRKRRGPGGSQHQPVRPLGKILVRQRVAEQRVIGAEVVDRDAALGDARRTAGFEYVNRLVGKRLRHPAPHRAAAQPFVLEGFELRQVGECLDLFQRIELQALGIFQPERAARRFVEMPLHDFMRVGIELLTGRFDGGRCSIALGRFGNAHSRLQRDQVGGREQAGRGGWAWT